MNKLNKSKISKIKYDIFEIWLLSTHQNVANYVQIQYNNDIAEAIKTMEKTYFIYPEMPQPIIKKGETAKEVEIKPSKAKLFIWKQL